jgi:hypothetical protein
MLYWRRDGETEKSINHDAPFCLDTLALVFHGEPDLSSQSVLNAAHLGWQQDSKTAPPLP